MSKKFLPWMWESEKLWVHIKLNFVGFGTVWHDFKPAKRRILNALVIHHLGFQQLTVITVGKNLLLSFFHKFRFFLWHFKFYSRQMHCIRQLPRCKPTIKLVIYVLTSSSNLFMYSLGKLKTVLDMCLLIPLQFNLLDGILTRNLKCVEWNYLLSKRDHISRFFS